MMQKTLRTGPEHQEEAARLAERAKWARENGDSTLAAHFIALGTLHARLAENALRAHSAIVANNPVVGNAIATDWNRAIGLSWPEAEAIRKRG